MSSKLWSVAEPCPPGFLTEAGDVSDIVAQILWNRGLRSREELRAFLFPAWDEQSHHPSQFKQIAGAVERVFRALENGERITVHGDYDADGVTGSAVLIETLREIEKRKKEATEGTNQVPHASSPYEGEVPSRAEGFGASLIDYYIPHRDKEGYGLHRETVSVLKERGTGLIITVDCGIACVDEIALARAEGMETIVVDHHQFGEQLPDAHLIHPGLPEETYPFKKLAAVGVAYKFAVALLEEARQRGLAVPVGYDKWLLDLVAIATVTDMVPLVGENRLLETFGLRVLNKTRRPGLLALIEAAGLTLGKLDTESVGFGLGPRLNAAGRMDHASLALRLMLADTAEEARSLANELETCNRDRQDTTRRMWQEAEEKMNELMDERKQPPKVIMLWDARWSPSLVGLLAGKFLDRYARPAVVIGSHAGRWIGSGRSHSSFDITQAMRLSGEGLLTRIGGHVQACGFSLDETDHLSQLQERMTAYAEEHLTDELLQPVMEVDVELSLERADEKLIEQVESLAPFGEGNTRPTFLSRACTVIAADVIGAQRNHLRLTVMSPSGKRLKCIGFKLGERLADIAIGKRVDLAYHLSINEWNGRREVQAKLIDIRIEAAEATEVTEDDGFLK